MAAELAHPWVAAYSDGSGVYVFPTELEALRYAVAHGTDDVRQMVEWGRVWPAPESRHDVSEADEPEPEPDPAPVPLGRECIGALPIGSTILDRDGDLYDRRADGWWRTTRFGSPCAGVNYGDVPTGFEPYTLVGTPLVGTPETDRPLRVGDRVRVRDTVRHYECRGIIGTLAQYDGDTDYHLDDAQRPDGIASGGHRGPLGDFERAPVD